MKVSFIQQNPGKVHVFKEHQGNDKLSLMKTCRICVDGNIGAGKTTFVRSLQRYLQKNEIPAKIQVEDMSNKMKTLELFLGSPQKYAFPFQLMMLSERINIYKYSVPRNDTQIIDRSLVGDYAFARLHHQAGNISDDEWDAYIEMIEKYSDKDFFEVPDYYLYLKTSPRVAFERIKKRNRGTEANSYDLEYLQAVDSSHKESFKSLGISYIEVEWDEKAEVCDQGFLRESLMGEVLSKIVEVRLDVFKSKEIL